MTAKRARDGKGHRAYRRASARLKREVQLKGLLCTWCGEPIDTTLPSTDRMSYTSDHPDAVANGGALVGQVLEPMHRHCNSAKNDGVQLDMDQWGAT